MKLDKQARTGYLFFLPALLVFILFVGYPFVYTVTLSFRDYNWFTKKNNFAGLSNYINLFKDPTFWNALGRTILYTAGTLLGQVLLALTIAIILNAPFRGINVLRSLYILPWILPTVVTALAWRMMLHERWGAITYILQILRITPERVAFLANTNTALVSVMTVSIWRGFPLIMVGFIAALQSIPSDIYEAAVIDGASPWKQLISITLPLLKKMVAIIILFRTIWIFNDFDLIWLMTRGGPASATETLPIYVYQRSFGSYKFGEAATIAMTMFLVLAFFSSLYFKMIKDEE
ncbi:carbohydrate ABC transporter permease [Breznakiella homolactica]|uniref:Sugar ABC transporter permease n=1 Tax=Breznakiella homolactica TaxID=2798577 RepID=A0A7T7XMB3_9SPIR|nr:sugar ABC transporter permease [Breznakiella homolactica]QQO08888.1 sugar ABC transporter permease [Breznakiella homolactica]